MKYDLCSPRPKRDGGTYWHRIGMMMPSDKGGFSIFLDSLPIADKDGKLYVAAFEQKDDRGQPAPRRETSNAKSGGGGGFDDDEIPF